MSENDSKPNSDINGMKINTKTWSTLVITDERLEALKDLWPTEKGKIIKFKSICRLNIDDVTNFISEIKDDLAVGSTNLLIVVNVGLHHIIEFKNADVCNAHEPLEVIIPKTKAQGITINKLSMNVINRLKSLKKIIKDILNIDVEIAFMPIMTVDLVKYQEFHVNLHFYKTKHAVQNMLFSPKEGKLFSEQMGKVQNIINRWIKSDLISYLGNSKGSLLFNKLMEISATSLTDGYSISKECHKEVVTKIIEFGLEVQKHHGIIDEIKNDFITEDIKVTDDMETKDESSMTKEDQLMVSVTIFLVVCIASND